MRTPEPDISQSIIQRYCQHGNNRPPQVKLEAYGERIGESAKLSTNVVAADVFIDLGMTDIDNSQSHFQKAEDELSGIVEEVDYLYANGFESAADHSSAYAVAATLRKSELNSWSTAAKNQEIEVDYFGALSSAAVANNYATNPRGLSKIFEFMPVLLFARAAHLGFLPSYAGRLALTREDKRTFNIKGTNANWDCGLAQNGNVADFDKPNIKLQIKASKGGAAAYKRANVIFLSASVYGFKNVEQIIQSCLNESDVARKQDKSIKSSQQLDEITGKIQNKITERH